MTDRELLERAAKAAGIAANSWSDVHKCLFIARGPYPNTYEKWNPLEDDGDALRLAVHLRLTIEIGPYAVVASQTRSEDGDIPEAIEPWHLNGPGINEATRRAIVRAAAAMSEDV